MLHKNELNQIDRIENLFFLNKNFKTKKIKDFDLSIYRELNSGFAKRLNRTQIMFFLKSNKLLNL
jgi:hypothetical protein